MKLAKIHHTTKLPQKLMIVGHRDESHSVVGFRDVVEEQIEHGFLVLRVQISRWLVRKYEGRPGKEGPAEGGALLLTLRELVGKTMESVPDAKSRGKLSRACFHALVELKGGVQSVGEQNIVENIQVVEEFEVLKYEPDGANTKISTCRVVEAIDDGAIAENCPGVGYKDAGEEVQESGFSRATRSDESHGAAAIDLEFVDSERKLPAVTKLDVGNGNHEFPPVSTVDGA